jgi:hypothetical protein
MIENFKLKVFRVVADNLNYRRAAGTPQEMKNMTIRLVLRIVRLLIGQNRPESEAELHGKLVLVAPATSIETRTRCRTLCN